MADRRSVRSSSRRITPTPQPPSKAATPATRAMRGRSARSVSHDSESVVEAAKPTRRSTRQASAASIASESDEAQSAPKTKRRAQKEAVRDLTTVEEVDTQIAIDDAPETPPRPQAEIPISHRSPGTISEMSGTTAISSFSMVEAEFLDSKFIMRHLPKLYDIANEFLEHVVPDKGRMEDDLHHIEEMQKPDSDFNEDYRDYNAELALRLNHFKSEYHQYIHLRAVHRALFGSNRDMGASQTGLDLVLYMANLLIFAKQMIHADRGEKEMWDALRELDNSFPNWFLSALIPGTDVSKSPTGVSALLKETFDLALDLRTQLAILVLQRTMDDNGFDPDDTISEVFFHSQASQEASSQSVIRGWNISALGGEHDALPEDFGKRVVERMDKIRLFFITDTKSLEQGDVLDLDGLSASFPWEATILRLLQWVRLRNREIQAAIRAQGSITAIVQRVRAEMEQSIEQTRGASIPRGSPRKKRTSFGRTRRLSTRKFDPNAPLDDAVVARLKARESGSTIQSHASSSRRAPQGNEGAQDDISAPINEQDEWHSVPEAGEQQLDQQMEEPQEEADSSGPPQSTADNLKLLKQAARLDKENRSMSIFDRQTNAMRVEFGDGFDEDNPTPGPSSKDKGKQRAQPPPRKRRTIEDADSDEDGFETLPKTNKAQERRQKAPIAKRVRIDPSSSGAPPSHQPPARNADSDYIPEEQQQESGSEGEAPEMTEVAPRSTYDEQRQLARSNHTIVSSQRPRKARAAWTVEEEDALIEYMSKYPQQYSKILQLDDSDDGYKVLKGRTQVHVKDKVRNMAINMIKSGTGLRSGFENVITPNSSIGMKLDMDGYKW